MKRNLLLMMLTCLALTAFASKTRVIENPEPELRKTGIYKISKIELGAKETKIHVHCTFVPHWWISFSKKESTITDCKTGKTYEPYAISGGEFDKYIWMPDSGDSTIVLTYKALDKSIEKIDFGDELLGIPIKASATNNNAKSNLQANHEKWLDYELNKTAPTKKTPSNAFFTTDTVRIIGFINGYDPRLGFSTGIVYRNNFVTNEDFPSVLEITADGRFDMKMPIAYATSFFMLINEQGFMVHVEPGETLGMILDWEDFLQADRQRNIRYKFNRTRFSGSLGTINKELTGYPEPRFDYRAFNERSKTATPDEIKAELAQMHNTDMASLETYLITHNISEKSATNLKYNQQLKNALKYFDYLHTREYEAYKDTSNQSLKTPIGNDYYSFLKALPLNDKQILSTSEFAIFINRLEYCRPLMDAHLKSESFVIDGEKFLQFLTQRDVMVPDNDRQIILSIFNPKGDTSKAITQNANTINETIAKYNDQIMAFIGQNNAPTSSKLLKEWNEKDSIMSHVLGLTDYQMVFDIIKLRSLQYRFRNLPKEVANEYWGSLKKDIAAPYLVSEGNRLYTDAYPISTNKSYILPNGKGTDIFNKLMEKHRGKFVFVDFWATTCGPCVSGIKRMKDNREKYKDNAEVEFVFITDVRSSPMNDYQKLVDEQQMANTYRIPTDDFNYLRQLFNFNGIPRYVVIGKNGEVIDDHYNMYDFEANVLQLLKSDNEKLKAKSDTN
jgi:thiol-disulfide isomerase/thioredoxin